MIVRTLLVFGLLAWLLVCSAAVAVGLHAILSWLFGG